MNSEWIDDVVVEGVQMLFALGLPYSPNPDGMAATCKAWIIALNGMGNRITWSRELDERRLAKAFITLCSTSRQWPTPAMLYDAMEPRGDLLKLPMPDGAAMSSKTRAMVDGLLKTMRSRNASKRGRSQYE